MYGTTHNIDTTKHDSERPNEYRQTIDPPRHWMTMNIPTEGIKSKSGNSLHDTKRRRNENGFNNIFPGRLCFLQPIYLICENKLCKRSQGFQLMFNELANTNRSLLNSFIRSLLKSLFSRLSRDDKSVDRDIKHFTISHLFPFPP